MFLLLQIHIQEIEDAIIVIPIHKMLSVAHRYSGRLVYITVEILWMTFLIRVAKVDLHHSAPWVLSMVQLLAVLMWKELLRRRDLLTAKKLPRRSEYEFCITCFFKNSIQFQTWI